MDEGLRGGSLVPSRLLSWISMSTTKLETLITNAATDRTSHSVTARALLFILLNSFALEDLETEITTISSQLAQSLYIIQGVSLHHKQSKRFLGRKYVLEVRNFDLSRNIRAQQDSYFRLC